MSLLMRRIDNLRDLVKEQIESARLFESTGDMERAVFIRHCIGVNRVLIEGMLREHWKEIR